LISAQEEGFDLAGAVLWQPQKERARLREEFTAEGANLRLSVQASAAITHDLCANPQLFA